MYEFDAVVIGAGVIGCAVARELARYQLSVAVLEKGPGAALGNSSRNTGLLHAGFFHKAGTLKASLCVEGNREFDRVAAELDIPFKRTGKLIVGFDEEDRKKLEALRENGEKCGVHDLRLVDKDELHRLEPNAGGEFALYSPSSGILDPVAYTIALAGNAASNGVRFLFHHEVTSIIRTSSAGDTGDCSYRLITDRDTIQARWVINCTGAAATDFSNMLGYPEYAQQVFIGEYRLLDKKAGFALSMPVYPAPNEDGTFSTHLNPTAGGNLVIGPENASDTVLHIDRLYHDGRRLLSEARAEDYIRHFKGSRYRNWSPETGKFTDFIIEADRNLPGTVNLVGIDSPGLTCALPIARRVVNLILEREAENGSDIPQNTGFDPRWKRPACFEEQALARQKAMIAELPGFNSIVCPVLGGSVPFVSVRLSRIIPRHRVSDVIEAAQNCELRAPVSAGQMVLHDVLGLGADLIASEDVDLLPR